MDNRGDAAVYVEWRCHVDEGKIHTATPSRPVAISFFSRVLDLIYDDNPGDWTIAIIARKVVPKGEA